ncbi:MAG: hypothetical protein ACI9VS_004205 [Candidatus Binatia bacterium]|jgi:hypothetical protein
MSGHRVNTPGTFFTDGMVQGNLPPLPDFKSDLEDWARLAKSQDLEFKLEIEGGNFSLLADNSARPVSNVPGGPDDSLPTLLAKLLDLFPKPTRGALFSTVRSVEYRKGEEAQTLYAIVSGGDLDVRQRIVKSDTTNEPESLASLMTPRRLAICAGAVVAALLILQFVLPGGLGGLFNRAKENALPAKAAEIKIDTSAYQGYFTAEPVKVTSARNGAQFLTLSIKRGTRYPTTVPLDDAPPSTWREALALQGLIKGYVRCEVYDASGTFLYDAEVRVKGLHIAKETAAFIPLPQGVTSPEQILYKKPRRPGLIVFTY